MSRRRDSVVRGNLAKDDLVRDVAGPELVVLVCSCGRIKLRRWQLDELRAQGLTIDGDAAGWATTSTRGQVLTALGLSPK
mgnify:CR=1 FL=1